MSNRELKLNDVNEIQRFADIFKALSNPNRLKIFLELLPHLESGGVCTSNSEQVDACQLEMAAPMNIAPSTVSHHIKELKHVGLVNITRCGRNVDIQINSETLHLLKTFLKQQYFFGQTIL